MSEAERQQITQEVLKIVQSSIDSVSILRLHKDWLSMREACEVANCSRQKMSQLIESGEVLASKTGIKGQPVMVNRKSINEYFNRYIFKPNKRRVL